MRDMRGISVLILMASLLCGCIIVKNYGSVWDSARPDVCMVDAADAVSQWEIASDAQVRTYTLNNQWGLMLLKEKPEDAGGHAYLYNLEGRVLSLFKPNPTRRVKYENEYPNSPAEITEDTVTFASLDDASLQHIWAMKDEEEYWMVEYRGLYRTNSDQPCVLAVPDEDE